MPRAARALAALAPFAAVALLLACRKPPDVSFDVYVPQGLAQPASWVEIGVFPGGCPPSEELVGGVPSSGIVERIAFATSDANPPAVGDLSKGPYGFAAAARAQDCSVVAIGCTNADVTQTRSISIQLGALENPTGACAAGSACENATCVPANDNSDPALGSNCSLELVGAGPLSDPLTNVGTVMSAPAIAATPGGFLIAYREYDPFAGAARLTLLPIDDGGGAAAAGQLTLPGQCAGNDESDATAMAFSGSSGLVVLARPTCANGQPGFDTFQIDPGGNVQLQGFTALSNSSPVLLSSSHALAPTAQDFLLAYTFSVSSEARVVHVQPNGNFGNYVSIGDQAAQTGAWVAVSDQATAVVALGSAGGRVLPDSGAPEGNEAGAALVQVGLAGSIDDAADGGLPTVDYAGKWAAVAALGDRAYVASSSLASSEIAWKAFAIGQPAAVAADSLASLGLGPVAYADVAFQGDNVFFAAEQPGGITLAVYDHATTSPALLHEIYLPDNPRIPSMLSVRDGRVAVAATDSRVAVVWTTGRSLTQNDTTGSYAVFACTP
jgi:hypothetical protein